MMVAVRCLGSDIDLSCFLGPATKNVHTMAEMLPSVKHSAKGVGFTSSVGTKRSDRIMKTMVHIPLTARPMILCV